MSGRNNSAAAGVSESVRGFYARGVPKHHRVMPLALFHVNAVTDKPFRGNPAAIYALAAWLDDGLLRAVAAENNLSEAVFVLREVPYELI